MWLQDTVADAAGAALNVAIEANGGTVFLRNHETRAGDLVTSIGGVIGSF
jgi:hypothetical protein